MTLTRLWHVLSYGLSDIGRVRDKNEDAWARDLSCHLYVLADGIGGRQAGEVASRRAVHRLCEVISQRKRPWPDLYPETICDLLWQSIQIVNAEIFELSQQNEFLKGMGTTLCTLLIHEDIAYIAHLGDSRIYLLREGQMVQLTQDHRPPPGSSCESSHLISRALGVREQAQPTVSWHPIRINDLFLLCSDGLSNSLTHEQICSFLHTRDTLKHGCHLLIEQAKQAGSDDNITALLVHLDQINQDLDSFDCASPQSLSMDLSH